MKILKIDFQNINSLRGEHHIDFTQEPFLQNSLFAITGPTGSGKTTILDVISLALFNQVPRLGKMSTGEILKKGAILTRNQTEAYAKITYLSKEGIFASTWSISTNRNGNLRDYHMEIANLETDAILDLKKSDVPAKNEELIGLNYDQFIKSVVLAQGEFAKFLQVPKKERGALLEKITGTEIYRRIGQEVYLRHKERAKELDEKRAKIATYKEQLLDDAIYAEKQQEAETLATQKEQLKHELERLSKEIELKNKLQKEETALQKTQNELAQVETQKKTFDSEKGIPLKRHEEIQLLGDELNMWQSLQEKSAEKQKEITAANAAIATAETQRDLLKKQFKETYTLQITQADFSEKLQSYKANLRSLINARNEIGATCKARKSHIDSLASTFNIELNFKDLEGFEKQLSGIQAEKENSYTLLEEQFGLKNKSIEKLQQETQQKLKQLRLAEKVYSQLENLKANLRKKKDELQKVTVQKAALPEALKTVQQQLELKEAQLTAKQKTLEVEQLQKQLDDYRNELKHDEPCPLCGSLHHPFAEHLPQQENNLKNEVTDLQLEISSLNKSRIEQETSLRQLTNQAETITHEITTLEQELGIVQKTFDTEFKTVGTGKNELSFSALEILLEEEERDLATAKKLQDEFAVLKTLKAQTESLNALIAQGTEKKNAIDALFSGSNFEQEIGVSENAWNRNEQIATQQTQLLKTAQEIYNRLDNQFKTLTTSLLAHLKDKGYTSIEKALEQRLNPSVAQSWNQEKQKLQTELVRLQTVQSNLVEEITVLKEMSDKRLPEELKEEQQTKNTALVNLESQATELSREILNQKQYLGWISDLKSQIDTELKNSEHWHILNDLIGDATGTKFNDFAQNLTLVQLLQLANTRLVQLTDRYRIDQPTSDEDDSLVAIDEHMGGQRRSIKTLSGGETFILSLALALALSDLASRNIEINSLFIDEGFGTLDPETLDQTLDTLEVLQAESAKMIGVISHVDSLKERIATQIQLTQNGQGYSTLKVV